MIYRTYFRAAAVMAALAIPAVVHTEGTRTQTYRVDRENTAPLLPQGESGATGKGLSAFAVPRSQSGKLPPSLVKLCPQNEDDWRAWLTNSVPFLLQTTLPAKKKDEPYLDPAAVSSRASQIMDVLSSCKAQNSEPPTNMLFNLRRFIESRANADASLPNPQHQLAHGITDDEFLCRAQPVLEFPCLLRSQTFLSAMSSPKSYERAKQLIVDQNNGKPIAECVGDPSAAPRPAWTTLAYRSRFLTTPDKAGALGRFLVVAPAAAASGVAHDRWIQFGIWTPDDKQSFLPKPPTIHNVSIVAASTGPQPSFDAMADWYRCTDTNCADERESGASTLPKNACQAPLPGKDPSRIELRFRTAVTGDGDDCQACHKMVPLSIHPEAVYSFKRGKLVRNPSKPEEDETVLKLNDLIFKRYHRPPSWQTGSDDKFGDPRDYGGFPMGMTPESVGLAERSDDYLKSCSQPYHPRKQELVAMRRAMNCADCHSGRAGGLGMLNYPQATEKRPVLTMSSGPDSPSNRNLVKSYVEHGVMPRISPKPALSKGGRAALYRCLSNEYFDASKLTGLFVDWLNQDDSLSAVNQTAKGPDGQPIPRTLLLATSETPGSNSDLKWLALRAKLPLESSVNGKAVFESRCARCHSVRPGDNANGPNLAAILRRPLAQADWPHYSAGLRQLGREGKRWDQELLMEFLKDQDAFLAARVGPGKQSEMNGLYPNEDVRRALVEYMTAPH